MRKNILKVLGATFLSATLAFSTPILAFADSTSQNSRTATTETTTQTVTEEQTASGSAKINLVDKSYTFYERHENNLYGYAVQFYADGTYLTSLMLEALTLYDWWVYEQELNGNLSELPSREEYYEKLKNAGALDGDDVIKFDGEYWDFRKGTESDGTYSVTGDEITITGHHKDNRTIVFTITSDGDAVVKSATGYWASVFEIGKIVAIEDKKLVYKPVKSNADTYTVELSSGDTVVSSETFNALLEENKTKDVAIKSNDGVTFTFAKGTMTSVEGMESYDFGTTLSHTYTTDLPSYITQDNFVFRIDYNYSGKLPAKANIRIYAGTQYAGKRLHYYLFNEDNTFDEVQTVIVDEDGYVTVKQDHCSNYLLTSEELKVLDESASGDKVPNTGDSSMLFIYILMSAASLGIIVSIINAKALENR